MKEVADRVNAAGMTPGIWIDGFRAHIARRIRTIVEDWGFPSIKIDVMRFGLNREIMKNKPAVTAIRAHDPAITDVERTRLGLQAMREAVGPDRYLLGCSAAFGKPRPVTLSGRHSLMLKYDGKDSFAQPCQKLQSR